MEVNIHNYLRLQLIDQTIAADSLRVNLPRRPPDSPRDSGKSHRRPGEPGRAYSTPTNQTLLWQRIPSRLRSSMKQNPSVWMTGG